MATAGSGTLQKMFSSNGGGRLKRYLEVEMPAKTEKQRKFMGMCTTTAGRKKAKKKCPPKKVAREFARKG